MSSSIRNTETCHIRLWINMIKIVWIAIAIGMMEFLGSRSLDPVSLLYWSFIIILGASSFSALVTVSLESYDVPRILIYILGVLSVAAVGLDLWNGYHERWVRELSPYMMTFFFLVFFLIQVILSANDMELDSYMSQYDYPVTEIRNARYVVHLAWNVLPYLIGVWVAWFIALAYDASTLVSYALCVTAFLLSFSILDEYLRHRMHWSFFWRNQPVSS